MAEPGWITSVPRNESDRVEVLGRRPPGWEYLIFGASLLAGLNQTEHKWRDHLIGYTAMPGPALSDRELVRTVSDLMSRGQFVTANVERVVSRSAQEAAFGRPGEPGDVDLIEHMGSRVIGLYEQLLDWHAELRSLRVSDRGQELVDAAHDMLSQPPQAVRDFVFTFVRQLEECLRRLAAGEATQIVVPMSLTLSVEDDAVWRFRNAVQRLR